MKTLVGKTALAAALVGLAPVAAIAQNMLHSAGMVNRNVERYTLLPGPYLLSPARTTPSMVPSPLKLSQAPSLYFYSTPTAPDANGRPTYLSLAPTFVKRPSVELLRFESTIRVPPPPPGQFQFRAVPPPESRVTPRG